MLRRQLFANKSLLATTFNRSLGAVAPNRFMLDPSSGSQQRRISTVGSWKLRPYATSSVSSNLLRPLTPGIAVTSLSLMVAPPLQIAQFALTIPTVMGASYLTMILAQRMGAGGAFQHNYYSTFLYFALSFMPVNASQNLMNELMFITVWLTTSYFAYSMLPELVLKDHMLTLFLVSFLLPLFPLAFNFMPLFNTRAFLTL
jgi:hypothetical protein